jgi:hypothetical protein
MEPRRFQHEFADVDRRELAADSFEHDVQPMTGRQHRVDERLGQVDAASARLEHPLDELLHLGLAQDHVGQLVPPVARDEHPAGIVDPDLLDLGIVEELLQRAEAGHPCDQLADHRDRIGHRRDHAGQAALVVGAHDLLGYAAHALHVELRVDPFAAYDGTHLLVELAHEIDRRRSRDVQRHAASLPREMRDRNHQSPTCGQLIHTGLRSTLVTRL